MCSGEKQESMDDKADILFESDQKNSHSCFLKKFSAIASEAFVKKVKKSFLDKETVILEYWPHLGQLIALEKGYENMRDPIAVSMCIEDWLIQWNEIADADYPDKAFLELISKFEKTVFSNYVTPIVSALNGQFQVKSYITNDE